VACVAVDVAVGGRDASVREEGGDLVEGFWALGPEIPLHVVVAEVCFWVAFLGVDEVGELVGVADEEDGGVVADEVPVALVGVELHGEATDIAFGVGGAFFACDC